MCLSVAVQNPDRVLSKGVHIGYEWMVTHNGIGYRCGYVRVPYGHPWHGKDIDSVPAEVHGDLTFGEPDLPCDRGGEDDAFWFGFDCAHSEDGFDSSLPCDGQMHSFLQAMQGMTFGPIRTTEYVESECRSLCEQASKANNGN